MSSDAYFEVSTLDDAINGITLTQQQKDVYTQVFVDGFKNISDSESILNLFSELLPSNNGVNEVAQEAIQTQKSKYSTVVQLNMDGSVLMADSNSSFSGNKSEAEDILGSAEKISDYGLLMADAVNKRAIITDVSTNQVKWEYVSDRYVLDAHFISNDFLTIKVGNTSSNGEKVDLNQYQTIVWENTADDDITIYSGLIDPLTFGTHPDLNLYGNVFKSSSLKPGDRYAFKFNSYDTYNWFSYPNLVTGKIVVSNTMVSSANQFIIVESDGLESPFSSRVVKIDSWGNVICTFGEGYLVHPKDARALLNNKILAST